MTREEAEARAAARTECLNEELRAKDRARYAWERARYEERVREADEQYERERLERRRQGELEWRKRHGLDGLGSSAEAHSQTARAWVTQLVENTLNDVHGSLERGDCKAAFDDVLRLTAHATATATHAIAAGDGPATDSVVNAVHRMEAAGVERFNQKCVIKRKR